MKNLRFGTWGGVALLAIAAASGCKQPDVGGAKGAANPGEGAAANVSHAKPYTGEDILLGEYGALTGDKATFGKSTDEGVQMALAEINAKGGVLGKKVRVVVENDDSKPEQAASAVLKLINESNVLAILGEVASSNSLAAAPICQKAGVPMLSTASTNPKVTELGDYIFRTCFIDPFQGTVGAKFARENLKAKKAAVLTDMSSDYSKGLTEYFVAEWKRGGGEIVAESTYQQGDKDFRGQLTKIKSSNPDVLYVPGYYTQVGNIAVQARDLNITQPLLGGDGWDSPKLFEIGKGALEGCYFSNHYSPDSKEPKIVKFVTDYKQRYGNKTPDAMAALGYDSTYVMVDAIKRAGATDREKVRDALAATKGYEGVTGIITMGADRNPVKPAVILQVRGNGYSYVTTVKP